MSESHQLTFDQAHRRIYRRVARNALIALGLIGLSDFLGTLGYREFVGLSWIDAFMNATMILTTMGPMDRPQSFEGKLFASIFALYSGVVFVSIPTLLITPMAQGILHRLHVTQAEDRSVS